MADLQVPPAVGTSGQRLDVAVVNAVSTIWRQSVVIGDPASSGNMGTVDSAGNQHVVSASSGLVQVLTSGTYIIVSASSGLIQLSSSPLVVVATSGGQLTVTASGVVALSSGTVTLSSNPTVISASSGNVGTFPSTGVLYSVFTFNASSSNTLTNVTTAAARLFGWNVGNQATSAAVALNLFNATSGNVGSTTNLQVIVPVPGGSAGAGNNLMLPQGVSFPGGLSFSIHSNFAATSTGAGWSAGDIVGTLYYI